MKKGTRAPVTHKKAGRLIAPSKTRHIKLAWPPKDIAEQNELGDQLVEWAVLQSGTKIEEFPLSRYLNPYHFKHIGDDNDYFKNCYEFAQYMIGARLQDGIHTKNETIDRELGLKLLPMYNREYCEMLIKLKTPAQFAQQNTGPQYIIMEKMPNSPLVPEREIEKT